MNSYMKAMSHISPRICKGARIFSYDTKRLLSKTTTNFDQRAVDEREVSKFDASNWWNENTGSNNSNNVGPLHTMQPLRLSLINSFLTENLPSNKPISSLRVLDVGCGGGIFSESIARLGAQVVAIDPSPSNILAAKRHIEGTGLEDSIDYRNTTAEQLLENGEQFDVVCALEVIEHVPRPAEFLHTISQLVEDQGALAVSTMNRSFKSLALAVVAAEYVAGIVPKGTHDWYKFQTPQFIQEHIHPWGLQTKQVTGMVYNPLTNTWFDSTVMTDVNYILFATKPSSLSANSSSQ